MKGGRAQFQPASQLLLCGRQRMAFMLATTYRHPSAAPPAWFCGSNRFLQHLCHSRLCRIQPRAYLLLTPLSWRSVLFFIVLAEHLRSVVRCGKRTPLNGWTSRGRNDTGDATPLARATARNTARTRSAMPLFHLWAGRPTTWRIFRRKQTSVCCGRAYARRQHYVGDIFLLVCLLYPPSQLRLPREQFGRSALLP